jgi:hypothetical protein
MAVGDIDGAIAAYTKRTAANGSNKKEPPYWAGMVDDVMSTSICNVPFSSTRPISAISLTNTTAIRVRVTTQFINTLKSYSLNCVV